MIADRLATSSAVQTGPIHGVVSVIYRDQCAHNTIREFSNIETVTINVQHVTKLDTDIFSGNVCLPICSNIHSSESHSI